MNHDAVTNEAYPVTEDVAGTVQVDIQDATVDDDKANVMVSSWSWFHCSYFVDVLVVTTTNTSCHDGSNNNIIEKRREYEDKKH